MGNYFVFLPETILVVVAFASIVLGFAWAKKPTYLWALALSLIQISETKRLRRISYAVFCLKKKTPHQTTIIATVAFTIG